MKAKVALAAAAVGMLSNGVYAANLIKNGGFENPAVQTGGYSAFATGQKIGEWSAIADSSVTPCPQMIVSASYQQDGIVFNAHSGRQWLNLGGLSSPCYNNASQGIQQIVATKAGTTYRLSFWIGSVYDPKTIFTEMPRLYAFQNGNMLYSGVVYGRPGANEVWQQFSSAFTAASDRTVISFMSPMLNPQNVGLDDVELVPAP